MMAIRTNDELQRLRIEATGTVTDQSVVAAGTACVFDGIEVLSSSTDSGTRDVLVEDQADTRLFLLETQPNDPNVQRTSHYIGPCGGYSANGLQVSVTVTAGQFDFNVCYRLL